MKKRLQIDLFYKMLFNKSSLKANPEYINKNN